jgi:hypothetical protein
MSKFKRIIAAVAVAMILPSYASAANDNAGCQAQAQVLLDTLIPFAEKIAGKEVKVSIDSENAHSNTHAEHVSFFLNFIFADKIRIDKNFCSLPLNNQRIVLAHELGHAIDNATDPDFRAKIIDEYDLGWDDKSFEISATARAFQIYRLAGLDASNFSEVWPLWLFGKYLAMAEQLQIKNDNKVTQ